MSESRLDRIERMIEAMAEQQKELQELSAKNERAIAASAKRFEKIERAIEFLVTQEAKLSAKVDILSEEAKADRKQAAADRKQVAADRKQAAADRKQFSKFAEIVAKALKSLTNGHHQTNKRVNNLETRVTKFEKRKPRK